VGVEWRGRFEVRREEVTKYETNEKEEMRTGLGLNEMGLYRKKGEPPFFKNCTSFLHQQLFF
jgi:hypothetical protein